MSNSRSPKIVWLRRAALAGAFSLVAALAAAGPAAAGSHFHPHGGGGFSGGGFHGGFAGGGGNFHDHRMASSFSGVESGDRRSRGDHDFDDRHHHRHFHDRNFAFFDFGGPGYDSYYDYGDYGYGDDQCLRRVWGPNGWRVVNVC